MSQRSSSRPQSRRSQSSGSNRSRRSPQCKPKPSQKDVIIQREQEKVTKAIHGLQTTTETSTTFTTARANVIRSNFNSLKGAISPLCVQKRPRDPKDPQTANKKQKTAPTPCLTVLKPQPIQMKFPPHPDNEHDRSTDWYRNEFRKLFARIRRFSIDYFGLHDLNQHPDLDPWKAGFSKEFVSYVEMVSDPDPAYGGWGSFLKDTNQRQWLIMAILTRILMIKVFGADLWGADVEEKNLLLAIERTFIGGDGFRRTVLRSETVRTILNGNIVTRHFHERTAKLTAKIALLLHPLTRFLNSLPPKDDVSLPPLEDQYQALHNIVACAAYLSICIRLSPSIFHFPEVNPGDSYSVDDQSSVEACLYSASKEAVTANYTTLKDEFDHKEQDLVAELAILRTDNNASEIEKKEKEITEHRSTQPVHPGQTHRGLVKLSIWPNIRRYIAGGLDDEINQLQLADRDGMRILEISKSAVLCYYGVEDVLTRVQSRLPLADFIEDKDQSLAAQIGGPTSTQLIYATAVFVPMVMAAFAKCDTRLFVDVWNGVTGALGNASGLV